MKDVWMKAALVLGLFPVCGNGLGHRRLTINWRMPDIAPLPGGAVDLPDAPPAPSSGTVENENPPVLFPKFAFSDVTVISKLLVAAIDNSLKTIDIAIYGLTLPDVADALVKSQRQGRGNPCYP